MHFRIAIRERTPLPKVRGQGGGRGAGGRGIMYANRGMGQTGSRRVGSKKQG